MVRIVDPYISEQFLVYLHFNVFCVYQVDKNMLDIDLCYPIFRLYLIFSSILDNVGIIYSNIEIKGALVQNAWPLTPVVH